MADTLAARLRSGNYSPADVVDAADALEHLTKERDAVKATVKMRDKAVEIGKRLCHEEVAIVAEAMVQRLREPDEATLLTAEKALRSTWNKPARERVLAVSRALAAAFEDVPNA